MTQGILVFFHVPANTGYAIRRYEQSFARMATQVTGDPSRVHFAYTQLGTKGIETVKSMGVPNVIQFDPATRDPAILDAIEKYVQSNAIDMAFGVDQPVWRPCFRTLRQGGVRKLISYWGAPMSGINSGLRLLLKRLQVRATPHAPDHYIFESNAMARSATHGRGIPASRVSVVYLGVDPEEFHPDHRSDGYLESAFGIPADRKVVVFSGHFEERKGVRVLIQALKELVEVRGRTDVHLLLLGNRPGEEAPYQVLVRESPAEANVTFAGYRTDISQILPNCHIASIASTGWDSLTVSAIEMAASGLPLVVSDLQGLPETVDVGRTGFTCPVGDHVAFADRFEDLLDDSELRRTMSRAARARVLRDFTIDQQVANLTAVCQRVIG